MKWLVKLVKKIVIEVIENAEVEIDPLHKSAKFKFKKEF